MSKVYLSAQLPEVATQQLKSVGLDVSVYEGDGSISHDELLKNVSDIDFLITPLSTKVDKEIIDAAPKLKLIANFGAGFNNIDTAYAKEKGIPVTNTPAVSTNAVAEVTIGLMLALSHRVVEGDQKMRNEGFLGGHHCTSWVMKLLGRHWVSSDLVTLGAMLRGRLMHWA